MTRSPLRSRVLTGAAAILIAGGVSLHVLHGQTAPKGADQTFLLSAFGVQQKMAAASPYKSLDWQFVGPANHTGRTTSIAVADRGSERRIYVGSATGGVWESDDRGDTWRPIFEHEATPSIGDVAVAPSNPDVIYVGTGEDNIFRASMSGTGMYKSTDAGKTWTQTGLTDAGTIGRILVDPSNADVVYAAATGHEWTDNEMRGVFKTTDGGKTWKKILYRSPRTGAVDMVMDPTDSKTLYVSLWQRIRRKWSDPAVEPGYGEGGVYKTNDAGATWTAINDGLEEAQYRGRIGVDIARSNPKVLYALIDSYGPDRPARPGEQDPYGRTYPEGAHLIRSTEVFRTDDQGAHWQKVSGQTPQAAAQILSLTNTYGWVFGQVRVDTKDENTIYILGVQIQVSHDGGKTFTRYQGGGGDNHRLWIDPNNPKIIYNACDQGFIMTEDGGATRKSARDIHVSQFYNLEVDNQNPFHMMGSVQDSGSYGVALDLSGGRDNLKPLPWGRAPGGEGSNQAIDPVNPNIIYSHSFYGAFTREDVSQQAGGRGRGGAGAGAAGGVQMAPQTPPTPPAPEDPSRVGAIKGGAAATGGRGGRGGSVEIRPQIPASDPPLRGEWMAPIIVSKFDHQTVYAGYQALYRSRDEGMTWDRISPDLTSNDPKQMGIPPSAIPYQTIVQIAESPMKQGLLYAGTDDGHLDVTRDDGKTWTDLTKNLPARKWISRVVPSQFAEGTVYVTQRGREDDDFAVYIWKSTDYGKTWTSLAANMPAGSVNVIREDPKSATTLYCGNDFGAYVTANGGKSWSVLGGNLPTVQVSDLQVQARDNIIAIATYGRGVWVMDALKVRAIK